MQPAIQNLKFEIELVYPACEPEFIERVLDNPAQFPELGQSTEFVQAAKALGYVWDFGGDVFTVEVDVLERHISSGKPSDPERCAICLAVQEQLQLVSPDTRPWFVRVERTAILATNGYAETYTAEMPEAGRKFTYEFDDDGTADPIELSLIFKRG